MISPVKRLVCFNLFIAIAAIATAQETNIDSLLQRETGGNDPGKKSVSIRTFKSTRVANGHSIEMLPPKILDVKIQHRFGYLSGGWQQFFGLDNATIRIGADYGLSRRLMIGGGRATYGKQWDAFVKYRILQQQAGERHIPVSIALLSSIMLQTLPAPDSIKNSQHFSDRIYYAGQLIIARRFTEGLSFQLMPTLVHYNIVPYKDDPNDIISIGAAMSAKISHNASLVLEYYFNLPGYKFDHTKNALSVGFDIETAGHVFQIMFTNAQGIAERPFISETTGNFFDGDISMGFNVSRSFQLVSKRKLTQIR